MKLIKSYKKLYKQELENRKLLTMQNSKLSEENVNYQKELRTYKEQNARLRIELGDMDGLLEQETKAKEELLKQRTQLRKLVTKLGGDWRC